MRWENHRWADGIAIEVHEGDRGAESDPERPIGAGIDDAEAIAIVAPIDVLPKEHRAAGRTNLGVILVVPGIDAVVLCC